MKKFLLFTLTFLGFCVFRVSITKAQTNGGVSISPAGTPADNSAALDVNSNNKGLLIPRLTTGERDAITSPTNSLMIYNTTDRCLQIYISPQWQNIFCDLGCSAPPGTPGSISGTTTPCQYATSVSYSIAQVAGATSYNWSVPGNIIVGQGTTGILVEFGNNSGEITVTASNACGISAVQTLAIAVQPEQPGAISGNAAPCESSSQTYSVTNVAGVTYTWSFPPDWIQTSGTNTNSVTVTVGSNSGDVQVFPTNLCGDGPTQYMSVTVSSVTGSAPTPATNYSTQTLIAWNWNALTGATGYKYNTDNNYSTATDNNANTSYVQTGLTCNTPYTLYVWAYDDCGVSNVLTLNATTFTCGSNVALFTCTGSNQTFTVPSGVTSINVKLWGAGGGGSSGFTSANGGGGGYAEGTIAVTSGQELNVIVGIGGQSTSVSRGAAGGGGGTAVLTQANVPMIIAGGGGGASDGNASGGGAGGGSSGLIGDGVCGGNPGTQSGPGAPATCERRTGAGGSGTNGGGGATGDPFTTGGYGYGNGGIGTYHGGDAGSGGGGGGYYGGGEGGGDGSGYGGGGGSGYIGGAGVSNASTVAGSGSTPGNSSDPERNGAGDGGTNTVNGGCGWVVITW